MKKNIQIKKTASLIFFVLFLCIIAFRLSFVENISIESFSIPGILFDNLISVLISCILLIISAAWLTIMFWKGKEYKYTGFEAGAFIFLIAAVLSFFYASNKRASLNDSLTILAVMASAIIMVQLLNSEIKRKILLFFLIAMAVVNVFQCIDQYSTSNEMMIKEYKANPNEQLSQLGIEPGSFAQMLYENRLYSKDVKGFFTTSNSSGSFLNLAMFSAIAVFAGGLKKYRKDLKTIFFPLFIIAILILGMALTASKGALVSLAAAFIFLCIAYAFGKYLLKYKVIIVLLVFAAFTAGIVLMISYGLKHDRLPGGNSMLVRWEYWKAAAEIIADNFLTGVGGNNFGTYFTHYKEARTLETVRDPHCFILTIFSSYGIVGLAGFLTFLILPICKAIRQTNSIENTEVHFSEMLKTAAIPAIFVLLFFRPLSIRSSLGSSIEVAIYIIGILYIAPVFIFATTLWVIARSKKCYSEFSIQQAAVLCGILAVIVHNLIDFGIFEPGILTSLFIVIALAVSNNENVRLIQLKKTYRFPALALTGIVAAGCIWLFVIPVGNTALEVEAAKKLTSFGYFDNASALLSSAIKCDVFNPAPANFKGTMESYWYQTNPSQNKDKLVDSSESFKIAISRDRSDFKNFEKLSETYQLLAEANPSQCNKWFELALDALNQAISRYPSGGDLHLKAATVAQQLNKTDEAIEHYIQAIAIEDAYREEFKVMYPDKEFFSRLGEINYNFAKQRLNQLRNQK
ncbi:MAG: O-antigen ligase family protein [Phycisphaerales bacterium]